MHNTDSQPDPTNPYPEIDPHLEAAFARLIQWGLDAGADPEEIGYQLPARLEQLLWELALDAGQSGSEFRFGEAA